MSPNDPRLDALQCYADGLATREDVALIERAIIDDAEFRGVALDYLHLDCAMEEFATSAESAPVLKPVRRAHWALAAAAAVAVMGLLVWHWWPETPSTAQPSKPAIVPPEKPSVAQVEVEVLQLVDAKFEGPNAGMKVHDRVRLDALDLRSGEAQLRLPSEVKLTVSGPAELRFIDALNVRVLHGKVTLDCDGHGKGFSLHTPVMRAANVSTKLGVEARADGATDVLVINGTVDLFPSQKAQRMISLRQGEALRVDAAQAVTRIATITAGAKPDDWSSQPPADSNIVALNDNFGAAESFHYYRILPHGLKPGAGAYTNRGDTWQAADGRDFPASLANADVVQTYWGERQRPANIEITVARPVELFVLMPRRRTPPSWLTENFKRNGEELAIEESGHPARLPALVPFDVWKRTVPQAGTISLGPGNREDRPFGIAVKALLP